LKEGVSQDKVEKIIEKVLSDFLNGQASSKELLRVKTSIEAGKIRGFEKIGGFSGKASALARGELYAGDPAFYKTRLNWVRNFKSQEVSKIAKKWLSKGAYQLTVLPFPKYQVAKSSVNRKKGLPKVGEMPALVLPKTKRAELKNGIKVVLMENHAIPLVKIAAQFDAGYAADSTGFKLGTSAYTLSMLKEGTEKRNALEISSESELLGASIGTGSNLDMSRISLSALKKNLGKSLELYADVVKNPAFKDSAIKRLRSRWMSRIKQEKARPMGVALRNLPPLLYGDSHAYGIPFTGSGTENSIASLTSEDLKRFYQSWIRSDNVTFFVVGDTTLSEILPLLNKHFAAWEKPNAPIVKKELPVVAAAKQKVIIIDKPGAPQSLILAGALAPPSGVSNNIEIKAMNDIIGGKFTSRINMNLREDKHWAYGAFTFMKAAVGQRPFFVYAPVQSDKTGASIKELLKELNNFVGRKKAKKDELQKTINNNVNRLPGAFETNRSMLNSLLTNQRFGRSDDYISTLGQKYRELKLSAVKEAALEVIDPKQFTWMIVGDRGQIEKQIRGINLGQKVFMDKDGKLIK
ncbi:MAG: insulinase family protein, partial [Halobacteriovoraceae bacterium]|nr:insulinase family protein [Halobacteriovoraceae bacterium]